jgi:uncharacterized small protein (DUF1192 family)
MLMPDDFEDQHPSHAPKNLTEWNIEDLQNYIANLEAEIVQCKQIIEQKKSLSSAADALFKK